MIFLKSSFFQIYLFLKVNDILKMGLITLGKDIHGIPDYGIDHIQHLAQFTKGLVRKNRTVFLTLFCGIGSIFGVIAYSLYIVYNVEHGTY